jgi:hypothetical protein
MPAEQFPVIKVIVNIFANELCITIGRKGRTGS